MPKITREQWLNAFADAKREARNLKCTWSQEDVPTDKPGLMAYINNLMGSAGGPVGLAGSTPVAPHLPEVTGDPHSEDTPSLDEYTGRHEIAADGIENGPPGYTRAQIEAGVMPKTQKLRDVCFIISKMTAGELGTVALEVIARGAKIGGAA